MNWHWKNPKVQDGMKLYYIYILQLGIIQYLFTAFYVHACYHEFLREFHEKPDITLLGQQTHGKGILPLARDVRSVLFVGLGRFAAAPLPFDCFCAFLFQ